MHRQIKRLGPGRVPEVDHINGNGLDNRRSNLRILTRSENCYHRPNGSKKLRGVRQLPSGKWMACITKNRKYHYLGVFNTANEASTARQTAARRLYPNI